MTAVALSLLGRPCLRRAGHPWLEFGTQRAHQVLVVLGWLGSQGNQETPEGWISREWLATLLWSEHSAARARANLRKVLLELRALELPGWEEGPRGLRWRPGSDVDRFADDCTSGLWSSAARTGRGTPMQGQDDAAADGAFLTWLEDQRLRHLQRWRSAVVQAISTATPEAAAELAAALLQADPQDPDARALAHRQAAPLLAPLSSMVGREDSLQTLLTLLDQHRLVTLLGPGGVGKSRLARHAGDACAPRFAHGCALVTLDDLSTPAAVPDRVASTLGLTLVSHASAAQALARTLSTQSLLLVLDGFEAVIDAAELAPLLLAAAPGLRLLVTSRERLDVDGEYLMPLAGLDVPATGDSAGHPQDSAAVRLFASRARAVQPDFDLAQSLPAVVDICRRVGGLPLAIEWAAAWMRILPASDLARDIAAGAATLGDGGPTAVFESSWRLLTAGERQAYASLAVFRGGFSREAAAQVAGVPLSQLAALVDKSMLRASPQGRLDMHPLVHDHARSKLADLSQSARLATQHAHWYLALLHQREPVPVCEYENLLAAWQHVVQQRDGAAVEAALTRLQWSTVMLGRRRHAVNLLEAAAAHFGPHTTTGANLQAHLAWILLWLDEDERARALAQLALGVLQDADHAYGSAMCLRTLGHAARRAGEPARAVALFEQALALPQRAGPGDLRAALLDALAMALNQNAEFDRAREILHSSLALNDTAGDDLQRMYNHYNLSQSHSLADQAEPALPWARSALEIGQSGELPFFLPYLHAELARVLAALGRADEAEAHVALAYVRAQDTGDNAALAGACDARARVALRLGDRVAARRAVTEAARASLATGNRAVGLALLPLAWQAFKGEPLAARWAQLPAAEALAAIAGHVVTD